MSKSVGNVVNPDDVIAQYGADALRVFEMFMGPLEQMKQAIYNIVRNAMQAAGEQGLISIQIQREGDFWVFECRDSGPGISPDHLPHLGSAFFTTREDGTGLGLMIVQRIAREHGGSVQITSREGKGTSVKLQIPLQEKRVHLLAETATTGEEGLMK